MYLAGNLVLLAVSLIDSKLTHQLFKLYFNMNKSQINVLAILYRTFLDINGPISRQYGPIRSELLYAMFLENSFIINNGTLCVMS